MSDALVRTGLGAARYRLTGHRMPLAVTLLVTHRCNALCATCAIPLRKRSELTTAQWVSIIDELGRLGTVRVGFTGGEPLVRDDIGTLVDRCSSHGIWTTVETNGYRYPEMRGRLGTLGRVMVSIEGPEEAHDRARESGSWRKATAAVHAALEDEVDLWTLTTISTASLPHLGWLLDFAEERGITAAFQLLDPSTGGGSFMPPPDATRKALRWLLEARAAGRPVGVSEKLLRYLLTWEDFRVSTSQAPHEDVHCMAGQLHCAIDADGTVLPCSLLAGRFDGVLAGSGFVPAFDRLRDNSCQACTSTPLTEYNYLYNLNAPALYEWGRAIGRGLAVRSPP